MNIIMLNRNNIPHYEDQYLGLLQDVVDYGVWTPNERTGIATKAIIGATFTIDMAKDIYPVITTRKAPLIMPLAEKLCYLKGLDNADDFAKFGAKTWFANANETKAWLANPNRKSENDCGRIYGVQGRSWVRSDGVEHDQFMKLISNLKNGVDDRGEILSYYNVGEFDKGCLRPCMHTHQFSLLGGELYLESYQRSADLALGSVANFCQVAFLLKLVAQMIGAKPAVARLHMSNCHIYENQYDLVLEQLKRKPFYDVEPRLVINPEIKEVNDIDTWVTQHDFKVEGYDKFHDAIKYPFAA